MHGRTQKWWACLLALTAACGAATLASGQDRAIAAMPEESAYSEAAGTANAVPQPQAAQNQLVSSTIESSAPGKDLEARVAGLEAQLKKAKAKEEEAAKKAAGAPSVKVIGRLQYDVATFTQNDASRAAAGDMLNGSEFRRARIGVEGDAFQVVDYRIEMDFAGLSPNIAAAGSNPVYLQQTLFKDLYITVKELPLAGNVRVGKFYECFGLETQTSDNYLTFMERSLINGGVGRIGDRKPGIKVFNWNEAETFTWHVGAFAWQTGEAPPTFPFTTTYDDAGGTALDMRLTWLPWYDEATEGRGYIHAGISYAYRDVAEVQAGLPAAATRYSISQLPEAHLGTAVVNTGNISDAARMNTLNPEFVWTYGPFSIQSEYLWVFLQRSSNPGPTFDGGYVQASYFLTGEHRPYIRKEGLIGRVIPFENFFRVRGEDGNIYTGKGAWEVCFRTSYLNLTDDGIRGGRVVDHTVGLTWYLNPYTKVLWNYVHSETTDRGAFARGVVDLFESRVAINF